MPRRAAEVSVPQPLGEPIVLNNEYGAARQYGAALKELGGSRNPEVAPHLLASVVESANSMRVPDDAIVRIARDLQAADQIVRDVPNTPVIYKLHCEYAVGLTPAEGTAGFRVVDTAGESSSHPHLQTVIPTKKQFSVRRGPNWEDGEKITEGTDIKMYTPLSFLASDDPEALDRFLSYHPIWMQFPNSHVVVGHEAVTGFLREQARRDLLDLDEESGRTEVKVEGVKTSWALLASSALRQMGYDSRLNQAGDFVHEAGVEALADIVAASMGYDGGIVRHNDRDNDSRVMRRLAGIEFDPEQDAQPVGVEAAKRALSKRGEARRFNGLLYGDEAQVTSHLTELAGNFMARFLDITHPKQ